MKKLLIAFMFALAIVMLMLGFQQEQREVKYEKDIKDYNEKISSYVFETYLPLKYTEAKTLSNEVKEKIIFELDRNYKDKSILKQELQDVISGKTQDSLAMEIIGNIINGVTLNGITGDASDNNDIIISIRDPQLGEYVIAVDMSYNCATEDRMRTSEVEVKQQFAKPLFLKAFEDMTKRGREYTYWSFLGPSSMYEWYSDVKNLTSTDLHDLQSFFVKYDSDLLSLKSFEFLATSRIQDKEDFFGNKSIVGGSFTGNDMTITVTSGFNLIDQLNIDPKHQMYIKSLEDGKQQQIEQYVIYKLQSYVLMLIAFFVFVILFLYVTDYRKS